MRLYFPDKIYGWVYHAELYFPSYKLVVACVSFKDEALTCFCWVEAHEPFQDLRDLRRQSLDHFASSEEVTLQELLSIR